MNRALRKGRVYTIVLEINHVPCSSVGNLGMSSPICVEFLGFRLKPVPLWILGVLSPQNYLLPIGDVILLSPSHAVGILGVLSQHWAGSPYKASRGLTETMTLSTSTSSRLHIAESAQFAIQCLLIVWS